MVRSSRMAKCSAILPPARRKACACSTSKVRPVGSMPAKPMKSNPAWKVPVQRIFVISQSPAGSVCRVSKRMSGNAVRWARMSSARNCGP
jgi:hypothetical protein